MADAGRFAVEVAWYDDEKVATVRGTVVKAHTTPELHRAARMNTRDFVVIIVEENSIAFFS